MKLRKQKEMNFGLEFLATGKDNHNAFFMSKTVIPPYEEGPPLHAHLKEEEGFYIMKGEITFIINDTEIEVSKGEFICIESGEIHSWRNDSATEAEMIVIFSPAGIEDMFRELNTNSSSIRKIGEKYGTKFLG